MSEAVTAIPTFGFARGAIVRRASGGPNMLVVRDLGDAVCVVRCEGDEAGTLRLREEQKDGLVQVLDHDGRHHLTAEIISLRSQLDGMTRAAEVRDKTVAALNETCVNQGFEIADLKTRLDEARRKAIEECAAIAKTYGGDCDLMISEFRALIDGDVK